MSRLYDLLSLHSGLKLYEIDAFNLQTKSLSHELGSERMSAVERASEASSA